MELPRVETREDDLRMCSVAANVLDKEQRTADEGWPPDFGIRLQKWHVMKITQASAVL